MRRVPGRDQRGHPRAPSVSIPTATSPTSSSSAFSPGCWPIITCSLVISATPPAAGPSPAAARRNHPLDVVVGRHGARFRDFARPVSPYRPPEPDVRVDPASGSPQVSVAGAGIVAIRSARMIPVYQEVGVDAARAGGTDRVHALSVLPGTGECEELINKYTSIFQAIRKAHRR